MASSTLKINTDTECTSPAFDSRSPTRVLSPGRGLQELFSPKGKLKRSNQVKFTGYMATIVGISLASLFFIPLVQYYSVFSSDDTSTNRLEIWESSKYMDQQRINVGIISGFSLVLYKLFEFSSDW